MNTKPKIYVIIPVYNCEQYLESAVFSVLNQPYKNINIILIDDGSKDNSPALCDRIEAEHDNIHTIHQSNQGVSAARNTAIRYIIESSDIKNSYIAFLDADDLWAKECLPENLYELLDQDIVCFGSCYMSNDGTKCSAPHGKLSEIVTDGGRKIIWQFPFHFGSFLYRVDLFKKYGLLFDSKLKYNEDKVLLMQMLYLTEKVRSIPRILYLYRKNPYSAMHNRPHGINYYLPLINGWMRSDDYVRPYSNDNRGALTAGYVMSCIYVTEMAKEHFWYYGKSKQLYEVIKQHPIYEHFLKLDPMDVSEMQYKEYTFFIKHPRLFQIKHNISGLFIRSLKVILRAKPIAKRIYQRQFTIDNHY